ncbi:hypothetical protein GALL_476850 [mine drainage metagenome]|uniref:Uncharacterized protein n=1 Tax=mine drainage metagenome TaxID=410659 RepID=A0A1J5PZJ2_9ZZZZ
MQVDDREVERVGAEHLETRVRLGGERVDLGDQGRRSLAPPVAAGGIQGAEVGRQAHLAGQRIPCGRVRERGEDAEVLVRPRRRDRVGERARAHDADQADEVAQRDVDLVDRTSDARDVEAIRCGETDEAPRVVRAGVGEVGDVRQGGQRAPHLEQAQPTGVGEQVERHREGRRARTGLAEGEQARPRRVEREAGTVRLVQARGVARQRTTRGRELLEVGTVPLVVHLDQVLERRPEPGADRRRTRPRVVQVEDERPHAHRVEARLHHVESGPLLGDEQHS